MKTQAKADNTWQLYTAKNQLSNVIAQAANHPQTITVRGKEKVVIISCDDYRKLKKPRNNIVDCLSDYLDDDDINLFDRDASKIERGTPIEQFN